MEAGNHARKKNPNCIPAGPGPARYGLPSVIGCTNHDIRKKREPCYSLGMRPETALETVGPGPSKYHPGEANRHGVPHKEGFMGRICPDETPEKTPAPYMLRDLLGKDRIKQYKNTAPDYLMGQKLNDVSDMKNTRTKVRLASTKKTRILARIAANRSDFV